VKDEVEEEEAQEEGEEVEDKDFLLLPLYP
jgi:hypothetical protein